MNPELLHSAQEIKTSKRELVMQIATVFVFPILLIKLGFIPLEKRVLVLIGIIILLLALLIAEKWTPQMIGIAKNGIRKYFLPYVLFSGVTAAIILLFAENITGKEELANWWNHRHFLYMFFVVSLFQEIAYRGYLMPALAKLFKKPYAIILTNVLLFTFLHSIFPNPFMNLPAACIGGIGFALMYMRYPSLPLIILSHAVLNFMVVLYGFFVIPGITY